MFIRSLKSQLVAISIIYMGGVAVADTEVTTLETVAEKESGKKELQIEVKSKKKLIQPSNSVSQSRLNREQIAKLPQGSEVSLPKLMAMTTPGAIQGPFGQTFFRGNHANIQYQIDGVQLPESPSNTFGQALSPRNIEQMEILTGGIPAEYGQRLGAVVNITTRSGPVTPEGEVELNYGGYNTVSPHLLYGGSNEAGDLHYFVSVNYNRTDRGLDTPQPSSPQNPSVGGKESIHNTAEGSSQFLKTDWLLDNQNKILFILYNSQNSYQIPNYPASFGPQDPFFQPGYNDGFENGGDSSPTYNYVPSNTDNRQAEVNTYSQVIWRHAFNEKSFLQIAPYYKFSSILVTNDPQNDLAGKALIPGSNASSFSEDRKIHNLGLKTDYSWRWLDKHAFKTGFQLQASQARGPISIQTDLNTPAFTDNTPNTGLYESFYMQDDYTINRSLILNAGVRFDATQFSFGNLTSHDSMAQPRIGLNYLWDDYTKFHVFYGKLFQPAPNENLRYQFNNSATAPVQLQYYDIKAEKDDFYEVGVAQQFAQNQVAQFNVYYKNGVNILDDAQLLNTSIAQPYNFETGFAYGAEISVKGQLTRSWSEFANYSYQIAKGKGVSGGIWTGVTPTSSYQFLDHVQVHTANAGLTYTKNRFWWTTQGLFGSGLRTGPDNSVSLPSHFTMDTSIGYEIQGNSWFPQMKVSADLLNAFDNVYPITIANGYNGSHYAAGRQVFLRVIKEI